MNSEEETMPCKMIGGPYDGETREIGKNQLIIGDKRTGISFYLRPDVESNVAYYNDLSR